MRLRSTKSLWKLVYVNSGWGRVSSPLSQTQGRSDRVLRVWELAHSDSSVLPLPGLPWPCPFPEGQRVQKPRWHAHLEPVPPSLWLRLYFSEPWNSLSKLLPLPGLILASLSPSPPSGPLVGWAFIDPNTAKEGYLQDGGICLVDEELGGDHVIWGGPG